MIVGFDFDGVIVNSISVMEKSWDQLSKKFNIEIPFSAYKENIGLKFNMILENIGLEKELFNEVEKDYFNNTKTHEDQVLLYPNVLETLDVLKKNKIQTFIITSKPRVNTLNLMKKFKIEVDLLVCADDVINGKPDVESGNLVYEKFGKEVVYYIGDMESDREFAENCRFNFIHAKYGYGLINKTPKNSIDSIDQILNLLLHNY